MVMVLHFKKETWCISLPGLCNKHHRLGGFDNRNLSSQFLVAEGPRCRVSRVHSTCSPLSLACEWPSPLWSSHDLLFVCVLIPSYKDASHAGRGSTQLTSLYLNYLCKDSTSKYGHILRYWGWREGVERG